MRAVTIFVEALFGSAFVKRLWSHRAVSNGVGIGFRCKNRQAKLENSGVAVMKEGESDVLYG